MPWIVIYLPRPEPLILPILNQRMARLQQYFALVHYSPMPTAGYFAGSLSDRVAQIQQALRLIENKGEPAWLMAVRGGYGAIDLLPQIPDLASDTPHCTIGFFRYVRSIEYLGTVR